MTASYDKRSSNTSSNASNGGGGGADGSNAGKSTLDTGTHALDEEGAIRAALYRGLSPDAIGPMIIGQTTLYGQLVDLLPASQWIVSPFDKSLGQSPGRPYLDNLFTWAMKTGHLALAHRCLEARYGLPPSKTSPLSKSDLEDLYPRLDRLDQQAANALIGATKAIATPKAAKTETGHEQTGTPLEEVLHGLELLRANLGTAVELTKSNDAPGGPATLGMHTIRVQLSMTPDKTKLAAAQAQVVTFLEKVQKHNAPLKQDQWITVDLLLNPAMKDYGMELAQFDGQHTVGVSTSVSKTGEAPMTDLAVFNQKASYMLARAAAAHGFKTAEDDPALKPTADKLASFVKAYPKLPKLARTGEMMVLQGEVIIATTKAGTDQAKTIESQWNSTYQTVGHAFGEDCKAVLAALKKYDNVISAVEIGNEPQAEWGAKGFGFPGTTQGMKDQTAEFIQTTDAAMNAIGKAKDTGPAILEAPLEWDAGTEQAILLAIKGGAVDKKTKTKETYVSELMTSSFHTRITQYVGSWLIANPTLPKNVPVSIHAYNSPEFDTALVQVLANVAAEHEAKLELYITEFQEDADATKPRRTAHRPLGSSPPVRPSSLPSRSTPVFSSSSRCSRGPTRTCRTARRTTTSTTTRR
jgi:hypothetical protein